MTLSFKYDVFQFQSDGGQNQGALEHLLKRGNELTEVARDLVDKKAIDYAVVSSCFYHTFSLFKEEYLEYKIKGKSVSEAVGEFMEGKKGALISECNGFGCEQECSPMEQNMDKHFLNIPT